MLLRLVLMGVGLGVITGSALKLAGPAVQRGDLTLPGWLTPTITPAKQEQPDPAAAVITSTSSTDTLGHFETKQELSALSKRWEALAAQDPDLQVSAFMLALDDGRYAQLNPDTALPAASAIKTPILLVALEEIDAGRLSWNEPLTLSKTVVGGGAGWMASKPLGTRFPHP